MAVDIAAFAAAYDKVEAAVGRLQTLIANGAAQKDIDDEKAVVTEVIQQFKEVAGIDPMPAPAVAAPQVAPDSTPKA